MIAVDTNILIRYFVRDDTRQAAIAQALISGNDVWVPKTVILETEWVLSHLYGFSLARIVEVIRKLAGLPTVFLKTNSPWNLRWTGRRRGLIYPTRFTSPARDTQ